MDAAEALADLLEISSQVEAAVIFDEEGAVVGSTLADHERAQELARLAQELLGDAERVRADADAKLTELEVATGGGSVFVVREGAHVIVATTTRDPTSGLVLYDLKSCLRSIAVGRANVETP